MGIDEHTDGVRHDVRNDMRNGVRVDTRKDAPVNRRLLLQFSQQGALKFAGHLDVMRIFQRTLRRAGLPIAFSQGFNPHPLLSFALPLPLGMESENDYAEIVLTESLPTEVVMARLNDHAPVGLRFTGVTEQPANAPSAAARVAAADYLLTLPEGSGSAAETLLSLMSEEQIIIPKKTKSGVRDTDIRPDIFALQMNTDGRLFMRLAAGSAHFLHPRIVAALILRRMEAEADQHAEAVQHIEVDQHAEISQHIEADQHAEAVQHIEAGPHAEADAAVLPIKRLALWAFDPVDNGFCSLQADGDGTS